ncbi:MAG: hypothetical protein RJA70_1125 [Pseudomonadota bacterium]|jgi:tetratricopeptide (TPR) repeat protein
MSPQLAVIADRFALEAEVGRGTSGVVYRALDLTSNEPVAIKLLSSPGGPSSEGLLREAEVLQRLSHPNIVRIIAHGPLPHPAGAFIAMEWLDGEDLRQRQQRLPLGLVQSLRLVAAVADALETAHQAGVIHRDIKPANIFLTYSGDPTNPAPKLVDFGTAKQLEVSQLEDTQIVGTPAYMAPEQVRGDARVGPRADVYSLGATLYELLSGQPPHQGPNFLATLARLATTPPRRLSSLRPELPRELDHLVHQLLALCPEDRPARASDVARALRHALDRVGPDAVVDSEPASLRLGSSVQRLMTTLVALDFKSSTDRDEGLRQAKLRGADGYPLGQHALVVHFGARRATGNEASGALKLGRWLSALQAHTGVATGRAMVPYIDQERPSPAMGEVVDRATALAREARAGQVFADPVTTELGRGRYDFAERSDGTACLIGRLQASITAPLAATPFVGRDAELVQIKAAFDRCVHENKAVVVTISGVPGIGKTRLQREAVLRLSGPAPLKIVTLRNEAYGSRRALGAAVDVLRSLLKLAKGKSVDSYSQAILSIVGGSPPPEVKRGVDVLARLLANQQLAQVDDARGFRDVLWLIMTQLVEASLQTGPLLLQAEDLQWADSESVEWLDHLLQRSENRPFFLLLTARNEFLQEQPDRFTQRDHVRIDLHPMSERATRRIAEAASGTALSGEALDKIVEQAGGSPLFAEELSRLAASGRSVSSAPTIQAAIQVSLDALDEDARDALGRVSVLGLSCWDGCLEALGTSDALSVLEELCQQEILVTQPAPRFTGMREWQFKHALVRDVAYGSLGAEQRTALHALAANWLSTRSEDPAIVARHYDLSQQPRRAAEYWASAAQSALGAHALEAALTMAERALSFAETPREAFARARLLDEAWSRRDARASERDSAIRALEESAHDPRCHIYARGARARYDAARAQGEDIDKRLAETRDSARDLGLHDEEARCSAELASRAAFAGRSGDAEIEVARLLQLAETRGMKGAAVDAWQTLGIVRQSQGALRQALAARRNAVTAAREADLRERESVLTTNLGFALTTFGARKEARELLLKGLALAEAIGSPGAKHHSQMLLLCWAGSFGTDRELDGILAELRADADAAAGNIWAAPSRENLGALYYRGVELLNSNSTKNRARARALLNLSAEAYRATQNRDVLPVALGMWSRAELLCGQPERALSLAREAADLLQSGAPSLLNEAVVYLALHDAYNEARQPARAREAVAMAMPPLERRLAGLDSTPYVRPFLVELPENSTLIATAENYGFLPDTVRDLLESAS